MNKLEDEQMRAAGYGAPPQAESQALCELCGEPMPEGEEMFKYHGYSCDCPKPPLPPLPQRFSILVGYRNLTEPVIYGYPLLQASLKIIQSRDDSHPVIFRSKLL